MLPGLVVTTSLALESTNRRAAAMITALNNKKIRFFVIGRLIVQSGLIWLASGFLLLLIRCTRMIFVPVHQEFQKPFLLNARQIFYTRAEQIAG
jgi:hypothetical protein